MRYTSFAIMAHIGFVQGLPRPSVQLIDNLDEPNELGFCIDLVGWGQSVKLDKVQMHSCKEDGKRFNDELFYPVNNSIIAYGDGQGRCLKPISPDVGSQFTTAICDLGDLQQSICWMADGTLRLQSDEMKCLVSTNEDNRDANSYKARDLTVALCDTTLGKHKLW